MIINNIYVSTQYEPGTELVFILYSQLYEVGISYSTDNETRSEEQTAKKWSQIKVHIEQELAQVHKIDKPISQGENRIWPSSRHSTIPPNNIVSGIVLHSLIYYQHKMSSFTALVSDVPKCLFY